MIGFPKDQLMLLVLFWHRFNSLISLDNNTVSFKDIAVIYSKGQRKSAKCVILLDSWGRKGIKSRGHEVPSLSGNFLITLWMDENIFSTPYSSCVDAIIYPMTASLCVMVN